MFSFEVEREKQTWYRLYFRSASVVLKQNSGGLKLGLISVWEKQNDFSLHVFIYETGCYQGKKKKEWNKKSRCLLVYVVKWLM